MGRDNHGFWPKSPRIQLRFANYSRQKPRLAHEFSMKRYMQSLKQLWINPPFPKSGTLTSCVATKLQLREMFTCLLNTFKIRIFSVGRRPHVHSCNPPEEGRKGARERETSHTRRVLKPVEVLTFQSK